MTDPSSVNNAVSRTGPATPALLGSHNIKVNL